MDLALMYDSWGITSNRAVMMNITDRHREDTSSLQRLNRILCQIFHSTEIPDILRKHSPLLGTSMLQYLCMTTYAAGYIIRALERDG